MELSSLLVVLSRLDILPWLEGVDRPDRLAVPLVERDCSAFSNARLMSFTETARLLFRLLQHKTVQLKAESGRLTDLKTSSISRLLELASGDLGVSELLSSRSAWLELWLVELELSSSRAVSPRLPISNIFRSFCSELSVKKARMKLGSVLSLLLLVNQRRDDVGNIQFSDSPIRLDGRLGRLSLRSLSLTLASLKAGTLNLRSGRSHLLGESNPDQSASPPDTWDTWVQCSEGGWIK